MTDATATAANALLNVLPSNRYVSWSWILSATRKSFCKTDSLHSAMRIMREDDVIDFKDGKYRQRTAEECKALG